MSLWLTYGLLGAIAGPAVVVVGSCVALHEPLSWSVVVRREPAALLAANALLSLVLVEVARRLPAAAGAVSWLVIMGLLLSVIDWACHRLPQAIVGTLLAGGVIQLSFTAFVQPDSAGRLMRSTAATASVFLIAMVLALVSPGGWGLGDVTLSATVAFFLGWFSWEHVAAGLFLAFVAAAVPVGMLAARGKCAHGQLIPFGPALVYASVCVIVLM